MALARPARGGRHSKNGDSDWRAVTEPFSMSEAALDSMKSLDFPGIFAVAEKVTPRLKEELDARAEGGGGWSVSSAVKGKKSSVTGDISWTLRCKSR